IFDRISSPATSQKVLDPAVGGGAFLTGWLRHHLRVGSGARTEFVGYDVSPAALAIASLQAARELSGQPAASRFTIDLQVRDTLAHAAAEGTLFGHASQPFDCVVGNPPYVRVQLIPQTRREQYRAAFRDTATGRFARYMLF